METELATTDTEIELAVLLRNANARLALLRAWLSHDHQDEPYWWARRTTAPRAQAERVPLRAIAPHSW